MAKWNTMKRAFKNVIHTHEKNAASDQLIELIEKKINCQLL